MALWEIYPCWTYDSLYQWNLKQKQSNLKQSCACCNFVTYGILPGESKNFSFLADLQFFNTSE